MKRNVVYTPDGEKREIDDQATDLMRMVETLFIAPYRDYILNNWLDNGKDMSDSMELRIKRYLDRLGSILLSDPGKYVILGERMQRRIAQRELPLAEYAEAVPVSKPDRVYRRRDKAVTREQRLKQLKTQYPGMEITWYRVDTDGRFQVDGVTHRVSHPAYQAVELAGDVYYPMDRIGVMHWEHGTAYLTQSLEVVPRDMVQRFAVPVVEKEESAWSMK